jgi:hypothetical protein
MQGCLVMWLRDYFLVVIDILCIREQHDLLAIEVILSGLIEDTSRISCTVTSREVYIEDLSVNSVELICNLEHIVTPRRTHKLVSILVEQKLLLLLFIKIIKFVPVVVSTWLHDDFNSLILLEAENNLEFCCPKTIVIHKLHIRK